METSIHWPEPSKIPAVIKELTRGMTNAPGAYWLTLPAWSAQQAAWLAFNVDPNQVMTPTWRIPGPRESREATARAGAAVITENLIAAVGERGSPADYVRAIRSLGIHPEWMGDHYRDECAPVATVEPAAKSRPARIKGEALGRRIEAILSIAQELGVDVLSPRYRGKQDVADLAGKRYPELFSAVAINGGRGMNCNGGSTFGRAWIETRRRLRSLKTTAERV